MWIPSFVIEQKRLQDAWMDLAPLLVDHNDLNYRATLNGEHQARMQQEQRDFNVLLQEFQNNPLNPMFYRDANNNPMQPLFVPPEPYDPTLQSTMDYYNNVYIKPNHKGQFPMGNHEPYFPSQFGSDRTAAGEAHLSLIWPTEIF